MTKPYNCEVFNQADELFYDAAREISFSLDELKRYRDEIKILAPGLMNHVGVWVNLIRQTLGTDEPDMVEAAESGLNNGALTTFGVINKVCEQTDTKIIDRFFKPENTIDSFPTESFVHPETQSILGLSMRGELLPERFPVIYQAGVLITARAYNVSPQQVRENIEKEGVTPSPETLVVAHYFSGAAEVALHFERSAEVSKLEETL